MKKLNMFPIALSLSLLVLGAGEGWAQNLCETALAGKSYTCGISSILSPTTISTVTMSFADASWSGVNTDFQMAYGGTLPFACTCMPSGKPGKVKTPEKSSTFSCIKAWSDGYGNDVAIDGRVTGGGSKIIKGRWISNTPGIDSYVFSCEAD
jgi:hypothetical protein